MCDVGVSLQTVLSARGWRAFCRSKIGLLHKIGAIAACQNHPSGCEFAPKPRQLPCRAVRIRSLARALRELRGALCASATAPGEGGRNAELVEFTHLLRSTNFIMRHWGVNRSGRAEATATPRAQSALGRRTGSPSARPGGGPIVWAHGFFALKYFVIDAAELRSRCRRLMRSCL